MNNTVNNPLLDQLAIHCQVVTDTGITVQDLGTLHQFKLQCGVVGALLGALALTKIASHLKPNPEWIPCPGVMPRADSTALFGLAGKEQAPLLSLAENVVQGNPWPAGTGDLLGFPEAVRSLVHLSSLFHRPLRNSYIEVGSPSMRYLRPCVIEALEVALSLGMPLPRERHAGVKLMLEGLDKATLLYLVPAQS